MANSDYSHPEIQALLADVHTSAGLSVLGDRLQDQDMDDPHGELIHIAEELPRLERYFEEQLRILRERQRKLIEQVRPNGISDQLHINYRQTGLPQITLSASEFQRCGDEILEKLPLLQHVCLHSMENANADFFTNPKFAHIRSLDLRYAISNPNMDDLFACKHLTSLKKLEFANIVNYPVQFPHARALNSVEELSIYIGWGLYT